MYAPLEAFTAALVVLNLKPLDKKSKSKPEVPSAPESSASRYFSTGLSKSRLLS
jgi:hypothetical protein